MGRAIHGRRPSRATIAELRQQATLAIRSEKEVQSLAELILESRQRAGQDAALWAPSVVPLVPQADDSPLTVLARIGTVAFTAVHEKQSALRPWNLYAAAARETMHWRFAFTQNREAIVGLVVEAVEQASMRPPASS